MQLNFVGIQDTTCKFTNLNITMKFGFRYFAWEFTSDGWVKNIIAKSSV